MGSASSVISRLSAGGVVEIPVTVYQHDERPRFLGSVFAPVTAVRKIDPNWFADAAEMRAAIDAAVAAELPIIVVFLHSFSFMTRTTDGAPVADQRSIDMFRALLDHVEQKGATVVTMRDLAQRTMQRSTTDQTSYLGSPERRRGIATRGIGWDHPAALS